MRIVGMGAKAMVLVVAISAGACGSGSPATATPDGGPGAGGAGGGGVTDSGADAPSASGGAGGAGGAGTDAGALDAGPPPLCATWTSEMVSSVALQSAYDLALAFAGDVPHVAFVRDGQSLVYTTRAAGVWTPTVVSNESGVGRGVNIAVDADGRPHLAYVGPSATEIRHSWLDASGTWQTEPVESPALPGPCSIAIDGNDVVHVVYSGMTRPRHASRPRAGGTWTLEDVGAGGTPSDLRLAGGALHVALGSAGGPSYAAQSATGWTVTPIASLSATGPIPLPRLVVSGGTVGVVVAFAQSVGWYSGPGPIDQWPSETLVLVRDLAKVYGADVALDAAGTPIVVYSYEIDSGTITTPLVVARRVAGGWANETASTFTYAQQPRLALDSAGRPHVVFLVTGGGQTLRHATCAP
jgi:hypothetical protein